jgi:hypothetical protein
MHDIHIEEYEGERVVEGPSIESKVIVVSIKVKKVNIGIVENPKMAIIRDYWDEQIVESITKLLCEYNDLFPTTFTKIKGMVGEIGEMTIPLRAEARPIRERPCRLNPIYKKKVNADIDRMLEADIIKPMEESKWISPMVVQEKKQGGIRICIDLRKLNDACPHDLFSTTFTDEALENVGGHEVYSFTDRFSGYHQIKIISEDKYNTTFSTEW